MSDEQLYAMRHSLAHVMAAAVRRLWPEAKFGVGPVVENGFHYDIDLGDTLKISEQNFGKQKKLCGELSPRGKILFVRNIRLMRRLHGQSRLVSHINLSY